MILILHFLRGHRQARQEKLQFNRHDAKAPGKTDLH
jgi:hypothetical protein